MILFLVVSFSSNILSENQMIEDIEINDDVDDDLLIAYHEEIPESCIDDIKAAEKASEDQICTDQFMNLECPHEEYVYGATNGCEISSLKEKGWTQLKEDQYEEEIKPSDETQQQDDFDRPQPEKRQNLVDDINYNLEDYDIDENIRDEIRKDILSAENVSEDLHCTMQIQEMKHPETGFKYTARNGCIISNLEDKGWESASQQVRPSDEQNMNDGEIDDVISRERVKERVENAREKANMKRSELNETLVGLDQARQSIERSKNEVAISVLSLISLENVTNIGKNVSEIARDINRTSRESIELEQKIQKRSRISTFFMGGDNRLAQDIENRVQENKDRIQKLNELIESSDEIDYEIKEMINEEIQNLEKEQNRLNDVANEEKEKRGIFGRLFGR